MTIESLLDLPASGLEALSDEQLTEMLSKYFIFTRPETVARTSVLLPKASKSKVTNAISAMDLTKLTPERLLLMREMAQLLKK